MGVGDRFDTGDDDATGQGNGGRKSKSRKTTRKAARASAAPAAVSSTVADSPRRPSDRYADRTDSRDAALRALLDGLHDIEDGHFDVRLTPNGDPLMAEVVIAFNRVASRNESMVDEMQRVSNAVGREGLMKERAELPEGARGGWARGLAALNSLVTDLMQPTTEVARVIKRGRRR